VALDVAYHLGVGGTCAALVIALWRHRSLPIGLISGLPGFVALVLAAAFSRDMFDFMRLLGRVDADLMVAGHTHGGQVQLPLIGPLITLSAVPRAWASGVTELEPGRTLVVSRGVGMERGNAPRLRFLCRPEVVIVNVAAAGAP